MMGKDRRTNILYVDVDGTLLLWPTKPGSPRPGETPRVNTLLVNAIKSWLSAPNPRPDRGPRRLVIWTMGGEAHARMAMDLCELDHYLCQCLPKPEYIIDDADAALWHKKHHAISSQQFIEETK